jgi:hypothetical protein
MATPDPGVMRYGGFSSAFRQCNIWGESPANHLPYQFIESDSDTLGLATKVPFKFATVSGNGSTLLRQVNAGEFGNVEFIDVPSAERVQGNGQMLTKRSMPRSTARSLITMS